MPPLPDMPEPMFPEPGVPEPGIAVPGWPTSGWPVSVRLGSIGFDGIWPCIVGLAGSVGWEGVDGIGVSDGVCGAGVSGTRAGFVAPIEPNASKSLSVIPWFIWL